MTLERSRTGPMTEGSVATYERCTRPDCRNRMPGYEHAHLRWVDQATESEHMSLVEFLRARLDEDEQAAKAAAIPAHDGPGAYKPHPELAAWRYVPGGEVEYVPTPEMERHEYYEPYRVTADGEGLSPAVDEDIGPHIARHDPARVLAEVEAKRRIVAHHSGTVTCDTCSSEDWAAAHPCPTLRLLALPHADHPDYDESWRP